jgi:hypothetical protein
MAARLTPTDHDRDVRQVLDEAATRPATRLRAAEPPAVRDLGPLLRGEVMGSPADPEARIGA